MRTEVQALRRRATRLAWFTIGWDAIEGVVAVTAGVLAGSIALVGFGIDSSIEVFAAGVVLWQLKKPEDEDRQRLALRLIGITFFALAAYVSYEAIKDLLTQDKPGESLLGILLNVVALSVMVPLARMKREVGQRLGSRVVLADAAETRISNYLSASVLMGLGLNLLFGWWWADPVAALVIAAVAVNEGREAWEAEDDGHDD
jgi:divalent metal cation (Fe/Co/Zn/Cd) transporter